MDTSPIEIPKKDRKLKTVAMRKIPQTDLIGKSEILGGNDKITFAEFAKSLALRQAQRQVRLAENGRLGYSKDHLPLTLQSEYPTATQKE